MAMPKALERYWSKHRRGKKSRRRVYMSRRGSHRSGFTLPLAVVLGFVPLVARGFSLYGTGGLGGISGLSKSLVPYDIATNKFDASELRYGLWPILTGLVIHKVVGSMLGVNRALASARVPFIRI